MWRDRQTVVQGVERQGEKEREREREEEKEKESESKRRKDLVGAK